MFQDNLMEALQASVGYYNNSGLDENQAVIKAASERDFNRDQTQRLVETFNTAKSIYFFKKAEDRRSEFGLADPSVVLPAMFDPKHAVEEKAASAHISDGFHDYSYYDRPETAHYGGYDLDEDGFSKVAFEEQPMPMDTDMDTLYWRMHKQIQGMKKVAEKCQDSAQALEYIYEDNLRKVAADLWDNFHHPTKIADAEHAFWEVCGKEQAEPIIDDLFTALPKEAQAQRADVNRYGQITTFDQQYPQTVELFKEAFKARYNKAGLEALAQQYTKEAEEAEINWRKAAGTYKEPDPLADFLPGALYLKEAQGLPSIDPITSGTAAASSEAYKKAIQPKADKAYGVMFGDVAKEIEKEKDTAYLKNLRRELILTDMVSNDPVLSDEDPAVVANAYQSLIDLAPEVSMNREVVRAILRNTVQTVAMHPHDAKSIVELQNEMLKSIQLQEGK